MKRSYHITQQVGGDELVLHSADTYVDACNWAHDYVAKRHYELELSVSHGGLIVALVSSLSYQRKVQP
jgi:hypothetical protein